VEALIGLPSLSTALASVASLTAAEGPFWSATLTLTQPGTVNSSAGKRSNVKIR